MKLYKSNFFIMVIVLLSGCVSTTYFSDEYSKRYELADNTLLVHCSMFTGWKSLWFKGLDNVFCLESDSYTDDDIIKVLPKGTKVRIVRIFKIGAVDATYSDAEVEIVLSNGKIIEDVYIDWPTRSDLIREVITK